jgi:hypothetical protein
MEKNTIKVLGHALWQQIPIEDAGSPKAIRHLFVQLERRQRELGQQRNLPPKREPH